MFSRVINATIEWEMEQLMDCWGAGLNLNAIYFEFWLPRQCSDEESANQCRRPKRCRFNPWDRKILRNRKWQHAPIFLPGKSHGALRAPIHGVPKSWARLSKHMCILSFQCQRGVSNTCAVVALQEPGLGDVQARVQEPFLVPTLLSHARPKLSTTSASPQGSPCLLYCRRSPGTRDWKKKLGKGRFFLPSYEH